MSTSSDSFVSPMLRNFLVATALTAAAMLPSWVMARGASAVAASSADAVYRSEVQRCRDGSSGQDLRTCMKEAAAARDAARRAQLTPASQAPCESHSGHRDAAASCGIRTGATSTSGSVEGGGVLYERREVIPASGSASGATR